jgi:hypothetical protein
LGDHFRQFARGAAAVAVNEGVKAFVKACRYAFGLFQDGLHIDTRGKPAHSEENGEEDDGQ